MNEKGTGQLVGAGLAWPFWGYLLLITLGELLTSAVNSIVGLLFHVTLLLATLAYGALASSQAERRLALSLALAPLIRLLSLTLPLVDFPQQAWYPLVSVPLLIATFIIVRQTGVKRKEIGLTWGNVPLQLMLMGAGLGLGALEYAILHPRAIAPSLNWQDIILPALSLLLFTGFNEEIVFRGVLQAGATRVMPRWGLGYVALLFGVLHIGYLSVLDVVFVTAVGLLFGYIVRWGGSILGVTLAHGLTNIMLFIVLPNLDIHAPELLTDIMPWVIGVGSLVSLLAMFLLWRGSQQRDLESVDEGPTYKVGVTAAKPA